MIPELYKGPIRYGAFIVGGSQIGSPSLIGAVEFSAEVETTQPKGEVRINLKTTPTGDMVQRLINELSPLVPIYFRVYLGLYGVLDSGPFLVGSSVVGGIDKVGTDDPPVSDFQSFIVFEGGT